MSENMAQGAAKDDEAQLFQRDGKPSARLFVPLALQHVVAAIVGIITPAMIVGSACNLPEDERALLIQSAMLFSGLVTLLQAHPAFDRIGSGLPVITGASFAFVPVLNNIGGTYGIAAIIGAQFIGGFVAMLFAVFLKQIKKLFPPVVTGTVVFCIGLSLYSVAVGYMAGGTSSADFGSAKNWIVALITLAFCIFFGNFTKGVTKLGSLLFGMLVGYAVALGLGMVNFSGVGSASWVALPKFLPFGIEFRPDAMVSLGAMFIIAAVEMIGDFSAVSNGALGREPTLKEIRGGILCEGIASTVGALFGGLPTATFAQNVGIATVTKVVNKRVFACAAGILIACGLIPKFAAVLDTIPMCVIGGATITVFGTITMTGIRILTKGGLTNRRASIAGLSVALGMGISMVSGSLAGPGIPAWVTSVFGGSAIVVTTLVAIILNLILPDPDGEKAQDAKEEAKELGE
ncbi:MAG: purine permease [Olsenella sp.]|nr:purine permease [Olsenella sp.]